MSEQGWRDFLKAGFEDWVVLHGGPTAVFRVGSIGEGARLAEAIAAVPGLGRRTALTITGATVTVRLTRELWGTEPEHIDIATSISAMARAQGSTPDRSAVQEVQITVSAKPAEMDLGFWHAVLGYEPLAGDNGLDPLGTCSTMWLQDLNPEKPLRHAMHLDVSLARDQAERRLAAAVAAGGRIVDESNAPGSWILADKANNKVCIAAWPDGADTPAWAAPEGDAPD